MKVIAAILCNINVISLAGNGGNETTRCVYCNVNTNDNTICVGEEDLLCNS